MSLSTTELLPERPTTFNQARPWNGRGLNSRFSRIRELPDPGRRSRTFREDYRIAYTQAVEDGELPVRLIAALLPLLDRSNKHGKAVSGFTKAELGEKVRKSARTMSSYLVELRDLGWVTWMHTDYRDRKSGEVRQGPNTYQLMLPARYETHLAEMFEPYRNKRPVSGPSPTLSLPKPGAIQAPRLPDFVPLPPLLPGKVDVAAVMAEAGVLRDRHGRISYPHERGSLGVEVVGREPPDAVLS